MSGIFDNADGSFEVPNQGGGYSTPDDAPFDWGGLFGDIIAIIPGTIDAVNGTSPTTIIYETPGDSNETDYTLWLFGFLILMLVIIAWLVVKK